MVAVVSLIISLITCYIVYKIFESRGFKEALFFKLIVQLMINLINGNLIEFYNSGISFLLLSLGVILIINIITTGIEYFVYGKTNSFLSYIIWGAVVEYLVSFAFSIILVFFGRIF